MMYNQVLFESFLTKWGIAGVYDLWIKIPHASSWVCEGGTTAEKEEEAPPAILTVETAAHQYWNGCTYLYFSYPGGYQICVRFFEEKFLEEDILQLIFHLLYPCYAEYALKTGEYKLNKMIDSIVNTTSSLDLEELFASILSNTMDVIPNADLGTLWLYDHAANRLVCKASSGKLMQGIWNMKFKIGEGVIGQTFKMAEPKLFHDLTELGEGEMEKVSEENRRYWDWSYDFTRHVNTMLAAPIDVNGQTKCVMILCQIKTQHPLTEEDLHLLRGFSPQIGIAMRNAQLFTDLKKQNDLLVKRDHIHATLTKLSMQSMGVNKVIRELNKMIGFPLLFVDLLENECIPKAKQLPDNIAFKDLENYLSSLTEESYYDIVKSESTWHYLYPIRSGSIILGCLIIAAEKPLTQLDHVALEQGNSVLALELVKKQNLVEFYYKKKRELFSALLQTKDSSVRLEKARELGLEREVDYVAVAFQFSAYIDPEKLEAHVRRLIAQLKKELAPYIQMLYGYHNEVTLLASLSSSEQFTHLKKQLNEVVKQWQQSKEVVLSGGIGSVYTGIEMVEKTYKEAKIAQSYFVSRKVTGCIEYSSIGVNRLFVNQNIEEMQRFLEDVFMPLNTSNGLNNTLEQTLITYFESNQSASQTAKKLHIHINTLYQRLRKIEDCLQLSFNNPEHVLRLQLACHLKESFGLVDS
ncbi:helix-turn-helix domain-containing protein [Pseudobacillus badius]|uniref:helix-turn-helix domain-containing protein n=1 Tax=Bacillus badius TaxID=1455 RepID=UPI002552D308|nr:helix-turn-helix domain-containing protein [Bacillus badius]